MVRSIPYLPPEIHRIVAQNIHSLDLPNYRLVNKACAEIGAKELFQTIIFHCSSASIERVKTIKTNQNLRKKVKVIFWDTNSWKIPDVRDLQDWETYFCRRASYLRDDESEADYVAGLDDLANNHQEWETYLEKVKDEKHNTTQEVLREALGGFENLRTIRIINGSLTSAHRGVTKIHDTVQYSDPPALTRGEGLHMGLPYGPRTTRPGIRAFETLRALPGLGLSKISVDSLCYSAFELPSSALVTLETLTSLHITFTVLSEEWYEYGQLFERTYYHAHHVKQVLSAGHLRDFLTMIPNLESLHLDLSIYCGSHDGSPVAPSSMDAIFLQILHGQSYGSCRCIMSTRRLPHF